MYIIKDLKKLKTICKNKEIEINIILGGGLYSTKEITYETKNKSWIIYNNVCGEYTNFKNDEALKKEYPLFIKAIENGCVTINTPDQKF